MSLSKTKLPQLIWHNFTNSQFTNDFCRERHDSILNWCDEKFLNWLRTSCVVSITTIAIWHTLTANFLADFERRIINRAINERQNDSGPVSRPKDCTSNTCCKFFDTVHCSDRHTSCLKSLTFQFIRHHQLWNDACIMIAMVTASAVDCCKSNCLLILGFN